MKRHRTPSIQISRFISLPVLLLLLFLIPVGGLSAAAETNDYQGIASPTRMAVMKAEAGGQVVAGELVEEGQRMRGDDVIARLDGRGQTEVAALATLRAESELAIERAVASVEELQLRLEQAQDMAEREAGSEWEVRQAQVELDLAKIDESIAREEQKAAVLEMEVEKARLERFTIRAPFDGRVMKLEAHAGDTVAQGDPIAVFASLAELRVELYLPVERYGSMTIDDTYELQAGPPVDRQLQGRLDWIDPMIDPASQTFRCVFLIDNPDEELPSGFLVWLPPAPGSQGTPPSPPAVPEAAEDSEAEATPPVSATGDEPAQP